MIRIINTALVLTIIIGFIGCEEAEEDPKNINIKTIVVSSAVYSGYPAVWFCPSTGEIAPITNGETPPEEKYKYWIEPRDPEFQAHLDSSEQDESGSKFIGIGENYFDEAATTQNGGFNQNLLAVGTFEANSVFYIRDGDADCLIMILEWIQDDSYLKFEWMKL